MDHKKIQHIKTDQIFPYELNNRIHTPEQIKFIADSIQRFGFNQPLVLDEDLIVLVGHGRLEAAKSIGLDKVPCYVIEGLSIEDKQAYRILDNKIQNDSTWNMDNLTAEIESLRDSGFDMGFCDLDDFMNLISGVASEGKDLDENICENPMLMSVITIKVPIEHGDKAEQLANESFKNFPRATIARK